MRWWFCLSLVATPLSAQTTGVLIFGKDTVFLAATRTPVKPDTVIRVDTVRWNPPNTARGIPWGPQNLMTGTRLLFGPSPFTLAYLPTMDPDSIIRQLGVAKAAKLKLVLQMTNGLHSRYLTDGKFDLTKWKQQQVRFDRPDIKGAIALGVVDGSILAEQLMDEPNHKSWGGVVTKPMLDEMSRFTKSIFPTLKTEVLLQVGWYPQVKFTSVDIQTFQASLYRINQQGGIRGYRDAAIKQALATNVCPAFSMNFLDGGDTNDGSMTAQQVEDWGLILGLAPETVYLSAWKHDSTFMADPARFAATKKVGQFLADRPASTCVR